MAQDGVHDAARRAPVEALRVDGAVAVEVGVRPRLEKQLEALEVVVGCTDVQGTDHQGGEAARERGPDVRGQVVVDIDVSTVPAGEAQGRSDPKSAASHGALGRRPDSWERWGRTGDSLGRGPDPPGALGEHWGRTGDSPGRGPDPQEHSGAARVTPWGEGLTPGSTGGARGNPQSHFQEGKIAGKHLESTHAKNF